MPPLPHPAAGGTVVLFDVASLRVAADHPRRRLDADGVTALARSIERHGLLQPVLVRATREGPELVAGLRRLKAHEALGLARIPGVLVEGPPAELALVENTQRAALDALELADALHALAAQGQRREDLARLIGRSATVVGDLLRLTTLPAPIREEYPAVRATVSRCLLVEIARIDEPGLQAALWEEAKAGTLTVRAARAARRGLDRPPSRRAGPPRPLTLPRAVAQVRRWTARLADVVPPAQPLAPDDRAALLALRDRLDALLA